MIGCSRCGHLHEVCECADVGTIGQNLDMFETGVEDKRDMLTRLDELNEQVKDLGSHYRNEFKGVKVDVYRVLQIFEVTDPVAQHIVKKLLRGTKKGHDEITVWNEVFQACERKKEMIEEEKDEAN